MGVLTFRGEIPEPAETLGKVLLVLCFKSFAVMSHSCLDLAVVHVHFVYSIVARLYSMSGGATILSRWGLYVPPRGGR